MMVLVACKVIYGAIFCYNFCHFLKKLRNSICYGHFWAAHGVMSIGVYLRLPVHRNSMKRQGHTKKISSFAFTLSILANCDTKITILACFNRFTIDRKFQRCHGGSWSYNWHEIDVLYGWILNVFQMVIFNVMLTSKAFAIFCMRSYNYWRCVQWFKRCRCTPVLVAPPRRRLHR